MLDAIKSFISEITGQDENPDEGVVVDKKLAAAALMVQVMAADGVVRPQEEEKLRSVLAENYELSAQETENLAAQAGEAQERAVDLYGFTSVLKRDMSEEERLSLVEDLWEMVFADGQLHEFEDNVVWRVAELLGIQGRHRMELKQRVLARRG